jgi:hypothetical protein
LFIGVVEDHSYTISEKWVIDLNNGAESLEFQIHGHTYNSHVVDTIIGERKPISREEFAIVVMSVKDQCATIANLLISQLDMRFQNCEIMEALGVVFPKYWLQGKCDDMFLIHLQVIKADLWNEVHGGGQW